jgi:hypothetical protein
VLDDIVWMTSSYLHALSNQNIFPKNLHNMGPSLHEYIANMFFALAVISSAPEQF